MMYRPSEEGGDSEDGRRRIVRPIPSSSSSPPPLHSPPPPLSPPPTATDIHAMQGGSPSSSSPPPPPPSVSWGGRIKAYVLRYIVQAFGGDDRSVAFFRFMIAVTVLGDLGDRLWNLHAHYSDEGVLPRGTAVEHFSHFSWWSVHFVSGRADVLLLVWAVHIAFGLMMLVGFHSQAAAVAI